MGFADVNDARMKVKWWSTPPPAVLRRRKRWPSEDGLTIPLFKNKTPIATYSHYMSKADENE